MSQSEAVPIDLDDKPRTIRIDYFIMRDIIRELSVYPGKGPITPLTILVLLGSKDPDTWAHTLCNGMKHEEPHLKVDRALRYFQEALNSGKNLEEIAMSVRRAGELGHVWEPLANSGDARGNA